MIKYIIRLPEGISSRWQKRREKMSDVRWTKEQMQAIEEKNANILVAAAARKWENSSFSRKNNK